MIGKNELLFSVLVPVYNTELYIRECINSVIKQTYKNWELILVDDGSTDHSGIICDQFAKDNEKIQVYHKKNAGQSATRSFAAQRAKGDYFVFLDSDDQLVADALLVIKEAVTKNNFPDCIIYGLKRENITTGQTEIWTEKETITYTSYTELLKKLLSNSTYNSLCRKAVKSSMMSYNNNSLANRVINGEDLIQSIELLQNAQTTVFIPDILYWYRDNEESITHRIALGEYVEQFLDTRNYVLNDLMATNLIGKHDLKNISTTFLINLIDIIRINSQNNDEDEKKRVYEKIRNHELYSSFILHYNHGIYDLGFKALFYFLFRHGLYNALYFAESGYRSLKRVLKQNRAYIKED